MAKNTPTGLAALAALASLLAGASALAVEAAPVSLSPAQIAEIAIPSVVLIQTATGLGSGFVVTKEGRIATNLHVIAGSRSATVILSDHRKFSEVEVLASDVKHDLAVLQIRAADLRPLPLGDSGQVRPGERVVAIGHPLGLGNTVSDGLVSAVRELSPTLSVLQISAPISPGSSGGPILNDRGQVIGISTLVVTEGQNLAFGMPVNQLKALLANAGPGTPIAAWSAPSLNDRKIPKHELSILAGCGPAEQQEIERRIEAAITSGAPLYNDGHHEACYRIYSGAALEIDRKVRGCEAVRQALLDGIRRSDTIDNYTKKAWAMRDAFDGVLDAISRGHVAAPEGFVDLLGRLEVAHRPLLLLGSVMAPIRGVLAARITGRSTRPFCQHDPVVQNRLVLAERCESARHGHAEGRSEVSGTNPLGRRRGQAVA